MNHNDDDSLRVAVVILGTEAGGIRRSILGQLEHGRLARITFDYVALCGGSLVNQLYELGVPVTVLSDRKPTIYGNRPYSGFASWIMPGGGFGRHVSGVIGHLRRTRPDLVYSHFPHTHIVCGLASVCTGIPVVGHVRGTISSTRLWGLSRMLYSIALSCALDSIVVGSQTVYQSLWPPVRKKARIIYNGLDTSGIESAALTVQKIPGRLVIVGRLVPGKKMDVAVHALQRLRAQGTECSLVVAGGPAEDTNPYFAYLWKLAKTLGLQNSIQFLGNVDSPYALVASAEVSITCSTVEGFGNTVAEAMICKTAVVVPDRGQPSEMVEHNHTGLHFRADDPGSLAETVTRLLSDRDLRTGLAQAAYSHACREWNIQAHMKNLRKLFDDVLAG